MDTFALRMATRTMVCLHALVNYPRWNVVGRCVFEALKSGARGSIWKPGSEEQACDPDGAAVRDLQTLPRPGPAPALDQPAAQSLQLSSPGLRDRQRTAEIEG